MPFAVSVAARPTAGDGVPWAGNLPATGGERAPVPPRLAPGHRPRWDGRRRRRSMTKTASISARGRRWSMPPGSCCVATPSGLKENPRSGGYPLVGIPTIWAAVPVNLAIAEQRTAAGCRAAARDGVSRCNCTATKRRQREAGAELPGRIVPEKIAPRRYRLSRLNACREQGNGGKGNWRYRCLIGFNCLRQPSSSASAA